MKKNNLSTFDGKFVETTFEYGKHKTLLTTQGFAIIRDGYIDLFFGAASRLGHPVSVKYIKDIRVVTPAKRIETIFEGLTK